MSLRSILKIVGVARFHPSADCIGFTLFGMSGSNRTFVAECNDDLNIGHFTQFGGFDSFTVEIDIPRDYRGRSFSIGDPIPIPFWLDGQLKFMMGDTKTYGPMPPTAEPGGVMNTLVALLKDARSGELRKRTRERAGDSLRRSHPDVFRRKPQDTRYWVARFALAASQLDLDNSEAPALERELNARAEDWLGAFLVHTDFRRLSILLSAGGTRIFSRVRKQEIVFSFFMHRLVNQSFEQCARFADDRLVKSLFPRGLINYQEKNGWPKRRYNTAYPEEVYEPLVRIIEQSSKRMQWEVCERVAYLMLVNGDLPISLRSDIQMTLHHNQDYLFREVPFTTKANENYGTFELPPRRGDNMTLNHNNRVMLGLSSSNAAAIIGLISGPDRLRMNWPKKGEIEEDLVYLLAQKIDLTLNR